MPTQEQSSFVTAAHAYRDPDTEGFNKYNSARIDDLYLALRKVTPNTAAPTDEAVVEVLRAARALNVYDMAYIRSGSRDVGGRVQAHMLRDMIEERLSGTALDAFIAIMHRAMNRAFDPPRIARQRNRRQARFPAFQRSAPPT